MIKIDRHVRGDVYSRIVRRAKKAAKIGAEARIATTFDTEVRVTETVNAVVLKEASKPVKQRTFKCFFISLKSSLP
ncbi:MAG: Uncharacterised protein [Acidimicrobiales bacterium AG-410-I20]|nr:MAG: Uncharacterised protein [Acidimicrobiales bacterium AG-410-I20]